MAFKKQYNEKGIDTTQQIGGYLGEGIHRVTIDEVTDLDKTIMVNYVNDFGFKFKENIFVSGVDQQNYSKKLQDLLSVLSTEDLQLIVENDDFVLLEGRQLHIRIARSEGHYIERRGLEFVVVGEKPVTGYTNYQQAKQKLDLLGNKAYLRVIGYEPEERQPAKGVW